MIFFNLSIIQTQTGLSRRVHQKSTIYRVQRIIYFLRWWNIPSLHKGGKKVFKSFARKTFPRFDNEFDNNSPFDMNSKWKLFPVVAGDEGEKTLCMRLIKLH